VTDPVDATWMRRCLTLARRGEGRTAPNPMVGCVIVDRRGEVLAEGWHRRAGAPHAEADALAKLGGRAPGATLYVNLEPCNHQGRTPPCAPAVLAAGIRRVVIGALDPIRGHAGGARLLSRRDVIVKTGVLAAECEELNRGFFSVARRHRPHVTLKAAASLDGRVATHTGESRWITGEAARRDGHRLRDQLDAILVGIGTVLADDPALTVRDVRNGRDPIRVIVDSALRTPVNAKVLAAGGRTIIATTDRALPTRARRLSLAGAELWTLPAPDGRVDLAALLTRLALAGVNTVLVEGGPTIHASLLSAHLADEVRLYLAPLVLGGHGRHAGPTWAAGPGITPLKLAHRLAFTAPPRRLGPDLLLVATVGATR
jgi:diaminohydroxyphosphoribosylaminopyrimidine deaminase/5-amino-6-(5-phosphoribosylamino)uracil reductase